jgi:peptidoglycan/xylan/chitin deacetylase (PgdA/CDA1 family)
MRRSVLRSGMLTAMLTVGVAAVAPSPSAASDCSAGYVALTFDDGPMPGTTRTEGMLDALKMKSTKGTFFVMGRQVALYPSIARRTVAEGNRLGNHTYSHPDLTRLTPTAIAKEFSDTTAAMQNAGLPAPDLMRPPYGATNSVVAAEGDKQGLTQVLWNVDPGDWKGMPAADVRRYVKQQSEGIGNIIVVLLHDAGETNHTVEALPGIIDDYRAANYCFAFIKPSSTRSVARVGNVELEPVDGTQPPPDPSEPVVITPPETANTPPSASITSPTPGATVTRKAGVTIQASASDSDGTVTKVEFFRGDGAVKLGEDTTSPYTYQWRNPPSGEHLLRVRATDDRGASATSAAVPLTVQR